MFNVFFMICAVTEDGVKENSGKTAAVEDAEVGFCI